MRELFTSAGWLKGNLHMHTTRSDGLKDPADAIAMYQQAGYDFVALTDHYRFSGGCTEGEILILSGAEYDSVSADRLEVFHIVCAGAEKDPGILRTDTVQQTIDKINASGGIAILAHPQWSLQTLGGVMPLKGLTGLEIYNSVSAPPMNCRPDSSYFSDLLSARGKYIGCMAADDSHPYTFESCRSWIMVNTGDKSRAGILAAIKDRRYYATQGPRIFSASTDGCKIHIECAPAKSAIFFTNLPWSPKRVLEGDITAFDYEMTGDESFVRIQIIDEAGDSAWLSPICREK